jgi:hypothetical protein
MTRNNAEIMLANKKILTQKLAKKLPTFLRLKV